jgi:F-type H+-transporting ATPase subunit epsilon
MSLRLRVVTPTRLVVDTDVTEITAPGSVGELGILPQHVTFLGQLDVGMLTYASGGQKKRLVVHGGYAEVIGDVVTILADDAEFPEEIDAAAARTDLERVSAELAAEKDSTERVAELLRARRRAEVRAAVAGGA